MRLNLILPKIIQWLVIISYPPIYLNLWCDPPSYNHELLHLTLILKKKRSFFPPLNIKLWFASLSIRHWFLSISWMIQLQLNYNLQKTHSSATLIYLFLFFFFLLFFFFASEKPFSYWKNIFSSHLLFKIFFNPT